MKMSFSLSSLQPSSDGLERTEQHARIRVDRPYNSLTKKRKEPMQEQVTKSWSGSEDNSKDDFWAAIRTNYDYIMDTNLIDTCKEANGELSWDEGDVSTVSWGLKEVSCQFSELYSWLRVLQELVYAKEENLLDKGLRAAHTEELRRKAYRRRLFNEQAEKLIARAPSLKEEVSWRVDHLNAKWDLVEQIMAPVQRPNELDNQDVSADFEHEVKCLRKWLREMEARLQPLNFRVDWSRSEIEEKAMEHMVLQRDIEAHGRIVSSVVKLGERVAGLSRCEPEESAQSLEQQEEDEQQQEQQEKQQQYQAARVASSLERRWHLLFLRALEWQCHIEALAARVRSKYSTASRCSSDSDDEEPVSKQPRLSRRQSSNLCSSQDEIRSVGSASNKSGGATRRRHSLRSRRQLKAKTRQRRSSSEALVAGAKARKLEGSSSCSDSDVSSENRSVDDGSYFEDDLDELCATSLKPEEAKQSGRAYAGSSAFGGDQGAEADIEEAGLSEEEPENAETLANMTPNPEPVSAATPASKPIDGSPDEIDAGCAPNPAKANDTPKRRRTEIDEAALRFNTSNRKSKNCATFYFKHMDTDSEADNNNNGEPQPPDNLQSRTADESTEEEWTYMAGKMRQRVESKVKKQLDFIVQSSEPLEESDLLNGNVIATKEEEAEEAGRSLNSSNSEEGVLRRERINKLVKEVEQLVQQGAQGKHRVPQLAFDEDTKDLLSPQNHRAKYARIKQWLELNTGSKSQAKSASQYCRLTAAEPLDSGDASNEYTTDDSEVERQYRTFEEDLRDSIASYYCRPDNPLRLNSNEELLAEEMEEAPGPNKSSDSSSPKVVLRGKHHRRGGARPWSVSCISQIKKRGSTDSNAPLPQHSISETALNKLVDDPAANSSSVDSSESRVPFNNSTSTLLGEQINGHDAARVARNSSLRRKKNRLRKKNTGRKSESGSDNVTTSGGQQRTGGSEESIASRMKLRRARGSRAGSVLSKSGSFSGCANHGQERMSSSWSDSQSKPPQKTSSESEEEVDEAAAALAATAAAATVALAVNRCRAVRYRGRLDSQPLHGGSIASCRPSPIAGASDNENNSFGAVSLEAWDNYQDKYSSEPYSEVVDTEAANRILEFGDDYRNYFDSQSDVSAYSIDAAYHRGDTYTSEESDSDSEVRHLTEVSHRQLLLTESSCSYGSANNLNELARVCRENIRCLRAISETRCGSRHGDRHAKQIRGLMERWESLSLRAEEAQKINAIHREMAAMKLEFCAAHERLMSYRVVLEEPNVIEDRINRITNELANLRDRKPAMLALNVSTHRLITDLGQKTSPTFAALKEGVADLYRLWDEAFQKGNQQLCALQAIQQFGARLTELQSALRRDKDTLAVLDAALQAGATMEVASSVKDVARLLSEKHEGNSQDCLLSESSLSKSNASEDSGNGTQSSFADSTTLVGHEGGSLSDSGISDSGSEQELSERERRLAALRRLTRTLESQLMPETSGDGLLVELWRRVEEAEAELRALQSQCRELIVRTAASVEARSASRPQAPAATTVLSYPVPSKRKKLPAFEAPTAKSAGGEKPSVGGCTAADDPDSEPSVPRSWVWRILRAALPFQLALVVLFCAACLLEPHCCEASNSLNLSLTPQLRYVRGPPPV